MSPTVKKFSYTLQEIADSLKPEGLTLWNLLELLADRGLLIFCVLLTLPFLLPVSIPGSSVPFGFLIFLISLGLIRDKPPKMPEKIMRRQINREQLKPVLVKGAAFFKKIEFLIHPRLLFLAERSVMTRANGLLMGIAAALMILPLPIPFTNTLPAYTILFLSLGSLERDGAVILLGYGMFLATFGYFYFILFSLSAMSHHLF